MQIYNANKLVDRCKACQSHMGPTFKHDMSFDPRYCTFCYGWEKRVSTMCRWCEGGIEDQNPVTYLKYGNMCRRCTAEFLEQQKIDKQQKLKENFELKYGE